jgi:hypothetical protein
LGLGSFTEDAALRGIIPSATVCFRAFNTAVEARDSSCSNLLDRLLFARGLLLFIDSKQGRWR